MIQDTSATGELIDPKEEYLSASERAILREKQKREHEAKIAEQLRNNSEPEQFIEPTRPFLISEFLRKPTGAKYSWSCPVGCTSR